jgi:hypothetical protein
MIYELRIYTTIPGRMPNLLARFENHTLRIWEKHGIKQLGFWYVMQAMPILKSRASAVVWLSFSDNRRLSHELSRLTRGIRAGRRSWAPMPTT